jgi:hypothetical protein
MSYLTKAEILAADDAKFGEVDVPEWGGKVRIRTLTGTERDLVDEYRQEAYEKSKKRFGARAYLCAMAICDEHGKCIFTPQDLEALGRKNYDALSRVFEAAWELNGLGEEAVENAKKNLSGEQSSDSGTSSLEPSPTPASSEQSS